MVRASFRAAGDRIVACARRWPHMAVVRDEFIWDDDAYVTHNPTLRHSRVACDLARAAGYAAILSARPYHVLDEYHLWGLAPLGYHIVNVLLHATSVILL